MRILQLTPRLAYPPSDGGRVVMLQIAAGMQRLGAEVRILSLNPKKQQADLEVARQALAPIRVDAIDIDTSSVLRSLMRIGTPMLVARFYSPQFERELRALLEASDVDVVQIESPFLLPYVPAIRAVSRAVIVLRSLNVEFRIWEQIAAREKNAAFRVALRFIAGSLRRYEIRHLNTCDAMVPITDDDARDFRALGCTRPMYVLPGGVDMKEGRPAPASNSAGDEAARIGFLGSLDYRPNQDGAIWIAEELGASVRGEVHVAGSNAPQWLRERLEASGITFDGEVPDAQEFIRSMDVMIAPVFSGGGMRIKILEAMALGTPVVATTIGAAGIGVRHGQDILLADDAEMFAAAVTDLLNNPAKAHAIGEAGQRLVASRYSTEGLARGLLAFYQELTQGRGVQPSR
ncbi:MAG TPA: glycosyltransferase family 4 protein [Thermoanaerobaculia bacterium]|nr:glycosyltransferase family 4 protein [Thermoanaerobaculia bacterium]